MKKILIIEDDTATRENLCVILQMENYHVHTAGNGVEGLRLAKLAKPDLILCDVTMPELDGHAVLEELRAGGDLRTTPFIFLSARGERRDLRLGMDLGADDYLVKPASATELLTCIEARMKRTGQLQQAATFTPDFSSNAPLRNLGLTEREAEVLLLVAQGKSNGDIATILGTAENTIKRHLQNIFEKLGLDNRHAAMLRAMEALPHSS